MTIQVDIAELAYRQGYHRGAAFERATFIRWLQHRVALKGWINRKSTWLWLIKQVEALAHYTDGVASDDVDHAGDLGAQHSPAERFQTYYRGFKDGAAAVAYRHRGDRDYMRGYEEGRRAAGAAAGGFAREVGHDLMRAILRSDSEEP
jgi:hypothetical protein